jgi:hypothetical protein
LRADKRRAEHQIVKEHYAQNLPRLEFFQTGEIGLRCPSVHAELIQRGVDPKDLAPFAPDEELLQKLTDGVQMVNTDGQPMSLDYQEWWRKRVQFTPKRQATDNVNVQNRPAFGMPPPPPVPDAPSASTAAPPAMHSAMLALHAAKASGLTNH